MALLTLLLAGCPRQVEPRVAGTDDDQIASYEARLEELRSRGSTGEPGCEDLCTLSRQICGVAENLCSLVADHPDRTDLPAHCTQARESCAEKTGTCDRCKAR